MTDRDALVGAADHVQAMFELSPVAMCTISGSAWVFSSANAAYRALIGSSEIVGHPVREVLPEVEGQEMLELVDRVYRSGVGITRREWRLFLDREGAGELSAVYVDVTATPYLDDAGAVGGIHFTVLDATTRATSEHAATARAETAERQIAEARELITTLQTELLPAELPVLPEADVAASYLLALDDATAGGDWFDAVVRPDGRVALVVGDVVGHGVRASAVMGQLRAVLHERLLGNDSLADALRALDRFALIQAESRSATVCVVELDPTDGSVTYCTAGHPPPLVLAPHGESGFLPPSGASPLGTGSSFALRTAHLETGQMVLLYSDGIIERPDVTVAQGPPALAKAAFDAAYRRDRGPNVPRRATERACELTLEVLPRATGYTDDITLLACQRTRAPGLFTASVPAETASVPPTRQQVSGWLGALDVGPTEEMFVQHALSELLTNAVTHGTVPGADPIDVELRLSLDGQGWLRGTVRDHGRWREPPAEPGGRGLAMASGMVDVLEVDHDDTGTTATFRHRLSRPARLFTGSPASAPPRAAARTAGVEVSDHGALVHGPFDATNAGLLRTQLRRATRGGSRALDVDLTAVTHLGSAAVQVLHELRQQGVGLRLHAPYGSPAQHVLDLVRLPYDAETDPGAASEPGTAPDPGEG